MQRAELPESARRGIAALLVLALGACVPTPRYSRISDKIENVTFEAPPAQPMPELPPGPGEIIVEGPPGEAVISRGERPTTRRVVTAAQRTPDGVQLNFDGADVREVVRVILGDILGRTYTINPAVSGQVTLSSAGPLAESDLIAILESSLRANNATIVDLGGTYEVIPIDLAYGRPETIPAGGEAIRVRPGYGVTVVPLRHISATSAAQFVQPLIPTPEDIRIDPARNLILFAGTGPDRQNVVDMLSDLDVNWLADKSVGLVPVARDHARGGHSRAAGDLRPGRPGRRRSAHRSGSCRWPGSTPCLPSVLTPSRSRRSGSGSTSSTAAAASASSSTSTR